MRALAISGRDLAVADAGNGKIEFFRVPEAAGAAPARERLPSVRPRYREDVSVTM